MKLTWSTELKRDVTLASKQQVVASNEGPCHLSNVTCFGQFHHTTFSNKFCFAMNFLFLPDF